MFRAAIRHARIDPGSRSRPVTQRERFREVRGGDRPPQMSAGAIQIPLASADHPQEVLGAGDGQWVSRGVAQAEGLGRELRRSFRVAVPMGDRAPIGDDLGSSPGITALAESDQCRDQVSIGSLALADARQDQPKPVVEAHLVFRAGQSQRGLEVGQSAVVVTEEGQNIAEGPMDVPDRRVSKGQRGLEVLASLRVGVDRSSSIARPPVCLGSLMRPTGERLVVGDKRPPANTGLAIGRAEHRIRDAAMEQSPTGEAEPVVGNIAKPAVGEVVANLAMVVEARFVDQSPLDQLVEAVDSLLIGSSTRRPHSREVERAADHRCGRQDLARDRTRRIKPITEQGDDSVWHPLIRPVPSGKRFGHVEGKTLRTFEQGVGEDRLDRLAERHRCELGHLLPIES